MSSGILTQCRCRQLKNLFVKEKLDIIFSQWLDIERNNISKIDYKNWYDFEKVKNVDRKSVIKLTKGEWSNDDCYSHFLRQIDSIDYCKPILSSLTFKITSFIQYNIYFAYIITYLSLKLSFAFNLKASFFKWLYKSYFSKYLILQPLIKSMQI